MSLSGRVGRGMRADSGSPAPWDDYWYKPVGYGSSTSGMHITEDSAKRIATVLACVGVIGRNVGSLPCKIYTEAPDGSKKLVAHHPLYDILYSRPNDQQTAFEFKQMMQGHLELRGNAYAEIIPGPRGAVDQLIPMHPDKVTVQRMKPSGKLRYVYNDPLTSLTRYLMQEEVFHLRNYSDDGIVGQSTVGMACDTFGVALAQQDYAARFLQNDARPPLALEGTNHRTKEQDQQLRDSWQEGQTGKNRGKVAILPAGVTIKSIGVTPNDQQLMDAQKFSRLQIASIFGVPPHLIGETEKAATYASVEQFNIMYVVYCLLPRLVMWEQAIQRDLLTSSKFFAKFSLAELLRGDTASRYAAYHQAIGDGWINQDEVRGMEGLNPIPGGVGKTYWRPVNWTTLDNTAAPVQPGAPAEGAEEVDDDDPASGDQGPNEGDAATATHIERLKLLATSAADRCVRREVAALRKMTMRPFTEYDLEEFYQEQATFVAAVMNLDAEGMIPVKQEYFERASSLWAAVNELGTAGCFGVIDKIAVSEAHRLATIATGGA